MKNYVVGLDGGGTKTAVEIRFLAEGKPLRAVFGSINPNGSSTVTVEETLRDCFAFLQTIDGGISGCAALCLGGAGISNPTAAAFWKNTINGLGYDGPIAFVGDHETALMGTHDGGDGAILIAGTGSICYGSARGHTKRTGGFGHLIDDEGGGYAIGRDILAACVRTLDGRNGNTLLLEPVLAKLSAHCLDDIIRFVYAPDTGKKAIASLSTLLPEAVLAKDEAALAIVEKCGRELSALAYPVIDSLSLESGRLALLGGIMIHDAAVRTATEKRVKQRYSQIKILPPLFDAASGAAMIALKLFKKENRPHA